MTIDSKYDNGMFDNTRKYFNNKIRFLIKKDKTLIVKFSPDFPLKKVDSFYDLHIFLMKHEYNFYTVVITEEIEKGYRNYFYINGYLRKIIKSDRNYFYD